MQTVSFYTQITEKNKQELDLYSKVTGVKKSFVINKALELFFNMQKNIPKEHLIEPTIYVDSEEFERLKNMDGEPTEELKKLFKND